MADSEERDLRAALRHIVTAVEELHEMVRIFTGLNQRPDLSAPITDRLKKARKVLRKVSR